MPRVLLLCTLLILSSLSGCLSSDDEEQIIEIDEPNFGAYSVVAPIDTGINVYSFALRPEEHQPSGTCNFSRIDNATLQLVLSNATVEGTQTAKVRVYATNYNVLRIMSGMGGLAYSN